MYRQGDVVFVQFPFSERLDAKERPALIIRTPGVGQKEDYLFVQITSATRWLSDGTSFPIHSTDFQTGFLPKDSIVRPHILFTGNSLLIKGFIGTVTESFRRRVIDSVKALLDE